MCQNSMFRSLIVAIYPIFIFFMYVDYTDLFFYFFIFYFKKDWIKQINLTLDT